MSAAVFDPFAMKGAHPVFQPLFNAICPPAVAEYAVTVKYQLPADAAKWARHDRRALALQIDCAGPVGDFDRYHQQGVV